MVLFHVPADRPDANPIELPIWKHVKNRWCRFFMCAREAIDCEIANLPGSYGTKFRLFSSGHFIRMRVDFSERSCSPASLGLPPIGEVLARRRCRTVLRKHC